MSDQDNHHISRLEHIASALDRFEGSLEKITTANAEILDRLTRMEVQQSGQAAEIHHQHEQMKDLSSRVAKVEIEMAVHGATTSTRDEHLLKRWGAIGAVALVILAAVGNALGSAVVTYYQSEERSQHEQEHYYDRRIDGDRRDDEPDRLYRDPAEGN